MGFKKISLLAIFALSLFLVSTSVAAPPFTICSNAPAEITYFVDGTQVFYDQTVSPASSTFTYDITMENTDSCAKTIKVRQAISNNFSMATPNGEVFTKVSGSINDTYIFDPITINAGDTKTLTLVFTNESINPVETDTFTTSFEQDDGPRYNFQFFFIHLNVPAIPEFPLAIIPVGIVLGSFFIINKRKR